LGRIANFFKRGAPQEVKDLQENVRYNIVNSEALNRETEVDIQHRASDHLRMDMLHDDGLEELVDNEVLRSKQVALTDVDGNMVFVKDENGQLTRDALGNYVIQMINAIEIDYTMAAIRTLITTTLATRFIDPKLRCFLLAKFQVLKADARRVHKQKKGFDSFLNALEGYFIMLLSDGFNGNKVKTLLTAANIREVQFGMKQEKKGLF
jgi:hypothetical protein